MIEFYLIPTFALPKKGTYLITNVNPDSEWSIPPISMIFGDAGFGALKRQ